MKPTPAWSHRLATLVILASIAGGCGSEEMPPAAATGTLEAPSEGLPSAVAKTRSAILAAAEDGDYDALRPLVNADVFLSDFGFGRDEPDPVGRWQAAGPQPLEAMGALLRMRHLVRETNEGTLYQWPGYDADSEPADLTPEDRELFRTIMPAEEPEQFILPELGYTGPRLGILADGTWWFFVLSREA